MTLPVSGPLAASAINVELSKSATSTIGLGSADARTLAGIPSGQIGYGSFYGKSAGTPLVATGSNGTDDANVVNNYYRRYIMSWAYLGSELSATYSRSSGTINSITISVSNAPIYQPYPDYAIGMKNGTFGFANPGNTGYTIVRSPASQSFVVGDNNISLTSPFAWSGQDIAFTFAWGQCPTTWSSSGVSLIINTGTLYYSRIDGSGTYVINVNAGVETIAFRPIITLNWA